MKIEHRHPASNWFAVPVSDEVDPEYEAEVHQATERGERDYRKAQERLRKAEECLAEARRTQQTRKRIKQIQELIELRRAELEDCRKLVTAAPVVQADKQVRHRTGLDDHLELGVRPKKPRKQRSTP